MQRAPSSCSPPRGVAANCAALRAARATPFSVKFTRIEACGAHSNVSCGPPRREASARAALRAAKTPPKARPSSPPRVRLTAAPLSLRRFFARLARFIYIRLPPKELNRFFRRGARLPYRRRLRSGRASPTFHGQEMLRISTGSLYPRSFFARLGKSCQNAQVHFDDFPL